MKKNEPIRVGQVWRNKTTRKTVRVTELKSFYSYSAGFEIAWETVKGNGQKSGLRWSGYWHSVFELIEDVPADV